MGMLTEVSCPIQGKVVMVETVLNPNFHVVVVLQDEFDEKLLIFRKFEEHQLTKFRFGISFCLWACI